MHRCRLESVRRINMGIREFCESVKEKMSSLIGEEMEIKVQEVRKNNNVIKMGIMVNDKSRNVAPTIYLDELYRDYQNGRPLEDIVEVVVENIRRGMPKKKVDMEFFTEYEKVKDKICYKLINLEKNEKLLTEIPYVPFLDLAICFFYSFSHEEIGVGTITIKNAHVQRWGVTISDLWRAANENTPRLFPESCCPMDGILMEMSGEEPKEWPALPDEDDWGVFSMNVLTNRQRNYGAAVILYDGYLARLAESLKSSFYVIPCSVHEVLIMPVCEGEEKTLESIIEDSNEKNVDEQEVLSDHLYLYDREKKKMVIIP